MTKVPAVGDRDVLGPGPAEDLTQSVDDPVHVSVGEGVQLTQVGNDPSQRASCGVESGAWIL